MTSTVTTLTDLTAANDESYYTIAGVGGDPMEWVNGYEDLLAKDSIGKPSQWFTATGATVNAFTLPTDPNDEYAPDLTFLLFPLDGLHIGRLAMFKIRMEDRWFDDIVGNITR